MRLFVVVTILLMVGKSSFAQRPGDSVAPPARQLELDTYGTVVGRDGRQYFIPFAMKAAPQALPVVIPGTVSQQYAQSDQKTQTWLAVLRAQTEALKSVSERLALMEGRIQQLEAQGRAKK